MSFPKLIGCAGDCPSNPPWKPTTNLRSFATSNSSAVDGLTGIGSTSVTVVTPSTSST